MTQEFREQESKVLTRAYRFCWVGAIGLLAVVFVGYGLPGLHMVLRTRAVSGSTPGAGREAVRRLLGVTREGPKLYLVRIVFLYAGLGALLVGLVAREWLAPVVAATPLTLVWWMRVRTTTPPIVLLLGTSTHSAVKRQRDVKRVVSPLRVVSLLDVDVPWDPELAHELSLDCFRTTNEEDWWAVVVSLIQCCPVIAIDAAAETEGVMREARHLLGSAFVQKCLFLTALNGSAPVLDHLLPSTKLERSELRVISYEEAPEAIARMVADLT